MNKAEAERIIVANISGTGIGYDEELYMEAALFLTAQAIAKEINNEVVKELLEIYRKEKP